MTEIDYEAEARPAPSVEQICREAVYHLESVAFFALESGADRSSEERLEEIIGTLVSYMNMLSVETKKRHYNVVAMPRIEHEAQQERERRLVEALEKARDTFSETRGALMLLGHPLAAKAMKVAADGTDAALRAYEEK